MGRGKEAADEELKDRTYRPRTMPPDPDEGSSGAQSVRSSARLRRAAEREEMRNHIFDTGDIPGMIAFHLRVLTFSGDDRQNSHPRRQTFMHDTFISERADILIRWPSVHVAQRYNAAMRLGMVNRAWRRRIFGIDTGHGPYAAHGRYPHDATGLYPVPFIVQSSVRMLRAVTSNANQWWPWDDERICVVSNPCHFDLSDYAADSRWDLMRMASRDMYHLHQSIDRSHTELVAHMQERIGSGATWDLYHERVMAVFERRWLNMRFMLGVIYLMAFVCQGLHLRSLDEQTQMIDAMQTVMRRFHNMADWNRDYSYMYNTVFETCYAHVTLMMRQYHYRRNNPFRALQTMLSVVGRTDDPVVPTRAMRLDDMMEMGTNPFYMLHLVSAATGFAGVGSGNDFFVARTTLSALARASPRAGFNAAASPVVYVTGQPIMHQMIHGQQPVHSLPENRAWLSTDRNLEWHTSVEVAFVWALRRAMAGRGVVPRRMWVTNVGPHSGEDIWQTFVNFWSAFQDTFVTEEDDEDTGKTFD
tara:strand:+ start:195 stop:1784 length:1590 start_codon:yes stop_codon:yes gene_type:complete